MRFKLLATSCLLATAAVAQAAPAWQPVSGHIMTKWAKQVNPTNAHPEYPRPQMVRKDWLNLNGLWDFAITGKDDGEPATFGQKILVPFAPDSALSGIEHMVQPKERIWYRRTFTVPTSWLGKRVRLNFDAVDWDSTVWVNGREMGRHKGGYDPFSYDITGALRPAGEQEVVLTAWDPTTEGGQPLGKQVLTPGGCSYTPVAGIWQTVWLEPVSAARIVAHKAVPDIDRKVLQVTVDTEDAGPDATVTLVATDGKREVSRVTGQPGKEITLLVPKPRLWSPDSPFLYGLKVSLSQGGKVVDTYDSYFGMRKISIKKDDAGIPRLALNDKILFQFGPLDQGFWPDGVYTAPTDEALRYDLELVKRYGGNMIRKHVKVEPHRLYYWADKLGILVWQDMPHGGNTPEFRPQFATELTRMIGKLYNHPSIIMWVVFNEGWGQHDTPRYVDMVRKLDSSRLINQASGWSDEKVGDVIDVHVYPGPGMPSIETTRAMVLGEYGGVGGMFVPGHLWKPNGGNFAYLKLGSSKDTTDAYCGLLEAMRPLIGSGLSAAVYTQTTDVEVECNGWVTYDRAVYKIDPARAAAATRKLYEPQPVPVVAVPSAEQAPQTWRYTIDDPGSDWFAVGFDDSSWKQGESGFGKAGTPGSIVKTEWTSPDIWIRRTFTLDRTLSNPNLACYHDEDAEVYINGQLAANLRGFTTNYSYAPLGDAAKLLKVGENTIAIHCHQTAGGQAVDCGITEMLPPRKRSE